MTLPFVDRKPTKQELEKLRLILSTYQDGTGQLAAGTKTLPGWRDFERAVAITFQGTAVESKAVFDVLLPVPNQPDTFSGISCKMRGVLSDMLKKRRLTIELSNAAKDFWSAIRTYDLNQQTYKEAPHLAGEAILNLVDIWKENASHLGNGNVDLSKSYYLVLTWDKRTERYHLSQLPLKLPEAETLYWTVEGSRLIGIIRDDSRVLFEWYGDSGGQLKYYPLLEDCLWTSPIFGLEPLPPMAHMYEGITRKAANYFPDSWVDTE